MNAWDTPLGIAEEGKYPTDDLRSIGLLIRLRRQALGYSLRTAARTACISPTFMSGLERGDFRPSYETGDLILDSVEAPAELRVRAVKVWGLGALNEYKRWYAVMHEMPAEATAQLKGGSE